MRPLLPMLAAAAAVAVPVVAGATNGSDAADPAPPERGWSLHLDNDMFALADEDGDYTAGAAFALGGEAAEGHLLSLSRPLAWTDRVSGFDRLAPNARLEGEALEVGLLLFTPQDLSDPFPQVDDRPYANLLYAASTKLHHDASRGIALQSSLTLGLLGLPLAESLHKALHEVARSAEPKGYANQISQGGEPTARYAVSRYALLADGTYAGRPYSLRFGVGGSVGYLTEANAEVAVRWGREATQWWSALPIASDDAGHPPVHGPRSTPRAERPELLLDAGIKLRARVYNSFLQGQWRDSAVTFSSSELEPLLLEARLGLTVVLANELNISYTLHYQSGEIAAGGGARDLRWASIGFAQRF